MYLQLLHEGWQVHVGKLYAKETDFVATKDGRTLYVQAADEMYSDQTRKREVAPETESTSLLVCGLALLSDDKGDDRHELVGEI